MPEAIKLDKPRLLTPGPTPIPEKVRLALALDMVHHRKAPFKELMGRVQDKLRILFGTAQEVLPLAASGTGAMVAALSGLFNPGEKILVVQGGKFGERWTEIAKARALIPVILEVEEGRAVKVSAVAAALDADPQITGLCVQISETSTGVQHPVRDLAALTSGREVLLLADGISAVGISPCPMDEWGIDCLLTGSQKGLMLPPGLAFIALSERAWRKTQSVSAPDYYFNLPAERANSNKNQTNFTPAIGLLVALDESLDLFMEAGLENIYSKQWALTLMARTALTSLGLDLYAPENFAWGLTSLRMPQGISSSDVLALAARRFNVIMAAGQGQSKNSIIRLGHMGWVDWADLAAGLHALAESLHELGAPLNRADYLEKGLAAYWQALNDGYPE
ncbi:alanine--glyoxylate aminotransferase family protein [Desulfovibrio sp. OttesenSCG-928-C14]|nr:alanine--glyoxylate aminotransferase family protein [Desulfovibrio sp. OttesenSCG-928-C14]